MSAKIVSKVRFYSQFNRPPIEFREYSEDVATYSLVVKNDVPVVEKVGSTNFQDYINSSCGYHNVKELIERFKRGDVSALNSKAGFFGDITGYPDNILLAKKLIDKSFSDYSSLPDDVKSAFGNYDSFMKSMGDGSYIKILEGVYNKNEKVDNKIVDDIKLPVVQDYGKVPEKPPVQGGQVND